MSHPVRFRPAKQASSLSYLPKDVRSQETLLRQVEHREVQDPIKMMTRGAGASGEHGPEYELILRTAHAGSAGTNGVLADNILHLQSAF